MPQTAKPDHQRQPKRPFISRTHFNQALFTRPMFSHGHLILAAIGIALPLLALLLMALLSPPSHAAEASEPAAPASEKIKPIPPLVEFITQHKGTFNGHNIKYQAIAGETALTNSDGEVTGHLFSTSYLRTDIDQNNTRPVAFVFNGGPGSASIWLHMGLLGPVKVQVNSDAKSDDGAAPYPMVANPDSILDQIDLVFIDPIGTGYSRLVGKGKPADYWGLIADTDSIADFIRLWINKHQRWNAPKYLIGESYGSPRAVGVSRALRRNGQDIALNGIVMISQAMDYTGSTPVDDNLIAYVTYLPTLAALAHYHGKAGQQHSLADFVEKSRRFATNEYLPALFAGNRLTDDQQQQIATTMAELIGLPVGYILRSNLRVLPSRFAKELLRDQGKTLGSLDGRYTYEEIDQIAGRPSGDAASESISSAFAAITNDYLQRQLKVSLVRPYRINHSEIGKHWDWRTIEPNAFAEPEYIKVARIMSEQLRRNKDLKVLVASGYYDLVTPFFDAEYTFARHGIQQQQVVMTYYPAGHMMYVNDPSFKSLIADIRKFIGPK